MIENFIFLIQKEAYQTTTYSFTGEEDEFRRMCRKVFESDLRSVPCEKIDWKRTGFSDESNVGIVAYRDGTRVVYIGQRVLSLVRKVNQIESQQRH